LNGKCSCEKFEFYLEKNILYEGIENYFIYMKFNHNYILEEIFPQNQLILYPEP